MVCARFRLARLDASSWAWLILTCSRLLTKSKFVVSAYHQRTSKIRGYKVGRCCVQPLGTMAERDQQTQQSEIPEPTMASPSAMAREPAEYFCLIGVRHVSSGQLVGRAVQPPFSSRRVTPLAFNSPFVDG